MVDLKVLQDEIDNLLEKETDDSLLEWYMSKKFPDFRHLLGEGNFFNLMQELCSEVTQTDISRPLIDDTFF